MKSRFAFTMIELIFVIVIMGIIGKFGVEFLAQAYKSFIFTSINHTLQSNSASAVEFISSRLQYRIKDSVIARTGEVVTFDSIANLDDTLSYTVLEWISSDVEGFRSTTLPNWSGIIDLNNTNASPTVLVSPQTNTTAITNLIGILSHGNSDISNAALYFIGSNTNKDGYGWDGNALTDQTGVMHPINSIAGAGNIDKFSPRTGVNTFTGIDVYEYYKLAWTANAVVIENIDATDNTFDLVYYFDYQPWDGEKFYDSSKNIKHFTIMKNISTFRFTSIGSILKIQVCAKSTIGEYSLCKEKTIF
ncbi:type II secretion system protein [Sulfurimonas sp. SAG-AH-194-L11]|nr:type II secretion system protein [Sulfurimonas sp. SAG-AH-194-L11]MDF1877884.1 type II secretion system protein [Sulfurimonas sp. SAG-AH-194-L11]